MLGQRSPGAEEEKVGVVYYRVPDLDLDGRAASDRVSRALVRCHDPLRRGKVQWWALLAQQDALGEVLPFLKLHQLLPECQLFVLERPDPLGGIIGQRGLAGGTPIDQASQRPADATQDEGEGRDERELGDVAEIHRPLQWTGTPMMARVRPGGNPWSLALAGRVERP